MYAGQSKAEIIKEYLERKNRALRSLLEKSKAVEPRAQTVDPIVARYSEKPRNDQTKTADVGQDVMTF